MKVCSIKKIVVIAFSMLFMVNAYAAWETVDGVTWKYTVSDGKASVGGDDYNSELAVSRSMAGKITIPASLGGYPVTMIGRGAFSECTLLTEVVIPDSITIIGDFAFRDCKSLTRIDIPDSVTSIRQSAFSGCHALEKVTIRKNVVNIEQYALMYRSSALTKLEIAWLRTVANLSAMGIGSGGNEENIVRNIAEYNLSSTPNDRSISSVEIYGNMALDSFVLKDGKVYDCAIRIVNSSESPAKISMPNGFVYEKFRGTTPLIIPAASTNILTITRTKADTFLLSREELVLETGE